MLQKTFGQRQANSVYQERIGAYGIGFDSRGNIPVVIARLDNGQEGHFLLGGGIENGETHSDCIIRECLEEAGLRVIPKDLVCREITISLSNKPIQASIRSVTSITWRSVR